MIQNPEDRRRQREEAARLRAEQARKRRKILLIAVASALALIGVIVLIVSLAGGKKKNASKNEKKKVNETKIHIVAGGDLNITDGVIASGGSNYDYTDAFMDVAPILSSGDLTLMNFEGTACGEPFGGDGASAPDNLLMALRNAGVDALQLANSFSIRQGISGLHSTVNSVRNAKMFPLGVYSQADDKGYVVYDIQGIRVAVVAFTKGMEEGDRIPPAGEGCVNLLYTDYDTSYQDVDTKGIAKVLEKVEEEDPDITIAMLHWGSKGNDTISKTQKEIVELMQNKGVDAIIGTHSHRVQQMTLKDGKFVAYSLGDFFGDATDSGSEYSVLLDLEIVKDNNTGEARIESFSYTPIYTVRENESLRVVRLETAVEAYEKGYIQRVSQETYESMQYAMDRIKKRISGES